MEDPAVHSMAGGIERNIGSIIKEYGQRLFSFIRSRVKSNEDAEDILQDVWFQLSSLIDLDSIDHLSGWLYQVARNRIIDEYRKKKPEPLSQALNDPIDEDFDIKEILLADTFSPEMDNLKEIFWQELMASLDELPENQRQVYIWNEFEDMTLKQIAENTGENLKTIISRKGYAVKHLRKKLENLYQELINY
ncbi:MAG TPA: sigma-70 family RNA polymerase sigma factor [Cyclobacteriaceae bacterium]|nr:sigma-70 family RNA polymerase sigma factor [Cyclobacteriaceae bacterium]